MRGERLLEQPASLNAAVPSTTRAAPAPSAAATSGAIRSPPPYCTGTSKLARDRSQVGEVHRAPFPRAVEVDHVEAPGARVDPAARRFERIGRVSVLRVVVALREADRLPSRTSTAG